MGGLGRYRARAQIDTAVEIMGTNRQSDENGSKVPRVGEALVKSADNLYLHATASAVLVHLNALGFRELRCLFIVRVVHRLGPPSCIGLVQNYFRGNG